MVKVSVHKQKIGLALKARGKMIKGGGVKHVEMSN